MITPTSQTSIIVLIVTTGVKWVELKRAMIEKGSSLNIIPLSALDAVGIPRDKITKQLVEVSSFRGKSTYTMGFVNLDLNVGPRRTTHKFYVIDSQTTYFLLLGRLWIHHHKAVPSTYHKCLKTIWKGKRVHVNVKESLFQRDDAHFSEAAYFDELAKDGEATLARPRGFPLPIWEDLDS